MKNDPIVIVPISMRDSLKTAVKEKSVKKHGERKFSKHVCDVLTQDLKKK